MRYLFDTGILLRLFKRTHPDSGKIRTAIARVRKNRHEIVISIQNVAEFWNVCTRSADARGGFGLTVEETERRLRVIERFCLILPEQTTTFGIWIKLLREHSVKGSKVHDARLVAWMMSNSVSRVLTLNPSDFARYPQIAVETPDAAGHP